MQSTKISFAINQKEGLAELRRRQAEEGFASLGLYAKHILLAHLQDGDDKFAQLAIGIEHLHHAMLQSATQNSEVLRRIEELRSGDQLTESIAALRKDLTVMFCGVLRERQPLTEEQVDKLVFDTLRKRK